jgi:valyl-tRNA synthetase
VTGSLHLGHALMVAVEDALVRWRRMKGDDVVWVPGTDHAGISTQKVVEAKVWNEQKKTRADFGRDEFVKIVWQWKEKYGARICEQLRLVGASLDWTRLAFTMDENLSRAVVESFIRFFDDGLVYRADRLVNWCCALETAISDVEVEYIDVDKPIQRRVPGHGDRTYPFGQLVKMAYKVKDSTSDEEIVVATTRIETMLGDTGVCLIVCECQ